MDQAKIRPIPEPSLRRLPAYLFYLRRMLAGGRDVISCPHIARDLHLDPTLVRKDFEATGMIGKPKVGYPIPQLVGTIEEFLGLHNTRDAFLVGAGHLGAALLGYEGFREIGLNVVAAFDADPAKVGGQLRGISVLPMDKLIELAQRMAVHIGIVTVPAAAAQPVADALVTGGIRAIWNFAPTHLQVPESVVLEEVQLSSSLAVLSSRLNKLLAYD